MTLTEKKVWTYHIGQALTEVFRLALQVNTNTDFCAIFNMFGHTGNLLFTVSKSNQDWHIEIFRASVWMEPNDLWEELDFDAAMYQLKHIRYALEDCLTGKFKVQPPTKLEVVSAQDS